MPSISTGDTRIAARVTMIIAAAAFAVFAWLFATGGTAHAATLSVKPRTIVTTDMEQDDYDSLIRYLLYSNETDTQGIIYSSSRFHQAGGTTATGSCTANRWTGNTTIEDQLIPAYTAAYPNLKVQDPNYPTPAYLSSIIRLGNINCVNDFSQDTPGSDLIKSKMLDDDPRPLWISAWGGASTIARALKSIQDQYQSTPDWPAIQKKVSSKTILSFNATSQDTAYTSYIQPNWPNIQVYNAGGGDWGYQTSGYTSSPQPADADYFSGDWYKANVLDVGPLGALYYTWGDGRQMPGDPADTFGLIPYPCTPLKCPAHPQYSFISEGDDPAFLSLFDSGLRSWQDPTWGGYGGRLTQSTTVPSLWNANTRESDESAGALASQTLSAASAVGATSVSVGATTGFSAGDPIVVDGEAETIASTATGKLNLVAPLSKAHAAGSTVVGYGKAGWSSARYVNEQQRDFANRLKWTVTPTYAAANHPPVVTVSSLDRYVGPGDTVNLDGSATDPDGNTLTYKWWEYKDVDTYPGAITFSSTSAAKSSFVVPTDAKVGQTIHAILQVTDNGTPALTRYQRVVVTVATTATSPVGGTVPATLALTLGSAPSFGGFTPGVAKDYTANLTANVISTAGDAALTVADPSSTAPGHLVNGSFSLPQALQASASSPGGTAATGGAVSGSPLALESWTAPISNDPVTVAFKQSIGANDALRTGSYSKTLTFTLSTTTP